MNNSKRNEWDNLSGPVGDWVRSVSLTEEESAAIKTDIILQNHATADIDIQLAHQLRRIQRTVAFSNRSTMAYNERHKIFMTN